MTQSFTHITIRASAGSGKTFQLSNRYLALLNRGVPPERILAVTFTRKAAGEIFDRILLRLADAADNEAKRAELSKYIRAELTPERCRELLCEVTKSLHRLRIGTLDSFFAKIAGTCEMEVGLPLGWRIVETLTDQRLRDRAIAESLAGESKERLLTLLHLLTKGEATRGISQLIRSTVNDLYATYQATEADVWKKVPRAKGLSPQDLVATLEKLERISFNDARFTKAVVGDVENVLQGAWEELLSKGLANKVLNGETYYFKKPIGDEAIGIYEKLLQHAKSVVVNQLASQNEATYDLLAHFDIHYRRLKHQHAALRFDDITTLLARVANSDDARTSFRLDARIDHLLLDEFQDTSLAQWQVLRPLAQRITSRNDTTSFLCVGDVKQAIYGWRGGLAELFDAVESELGSLSKHHLTESFRSSPAVIEVVNQVFENLNRHTNLDNLEPAVAKWQKKFQSHTTAKKALAGYVTLEAAPAADEEEDADEQFAEFLAEQIAEQYRRSPGCTIGVLTRTNDALRDLIFRLRARNVPASEEGGNPLVDSAAVDLLLSLVRLADHPGDRAAYFHLRTSPLAAHFGLTRDDPSRPAMYLAERLRQQLLDDGYGRAIYAWSQVLAPSCDARERMRLQQLVELAYAYQAESTLRPADFLEYVAETKVSDPTTAAVRVMTVHQAKGLEFDIVFLPELDARLRGQTPTFVVSRPSPGEPLDCVCRYANENVQQMLPNSFQEMFSASLANEVSEALCVLYVALTRAVHALHILIRPLSEKEKALPKTFAGLVRAAVCNDNSPKTGKLFEYGQRDWYARTFSTPVAPVAKLESISLSKIQLAPALPDRRRGLQRESPSQLEGGSLAKQARVFELVDQNRELAMLRGTAFHACFEQVSWLDASTPRPEDYLAAMQRVPDLVRSTLAQRQTWLADYLQCLSKPEIAGVLTRASYLATLPKPIAALLGNVELEVHNEWPFVSISGTQMLQGRMDRLVILRQEDQIVAVDVLDYKTDLITNQPGQALAECVEFYRPQLEAYRATLAQRFQLPLERVISGILFVGPGKLVR